MNSIAINGEDLLGFDTQQLIIGRGKIRALINTSNYIKTTADSFQQFVLWTGVFEHFFPPFADKLNKFEGTTNLPALTIPPKIRVRHLDKSKNTLSNSVTDKVRAYKKESLYFSIDNAADYEANAEIHWMVRNQDNDAYRVNDLGHTTVMTLHEERYENCEYSGTHFMECLIISGGKICGIDAVKVSIVGFSRPLRNPPRKKYF